MPEPGLLDRFVARGGRALDVANVYRDGESARAVGRWLRGGADVALYAKGCHPPHCAPALVAAGDRPSPARCWAWTGSTCSCCTATTRRCRWRPGRTRLQEQVAAGTIGAFGVSNWTVDRLRALHREVDGGPLRAFSNHFSLADMVSPPWPDCLAVTARRAAFAGRVWT